MAHTLHRAFDVARARTASVFMLSFFAHLSETARIDLMALVLTALAACLCAVVLALLLETGWAWRLAIDHPNDRSLHERPIPRCGGWGIVLTLLVILFPATPALWPLWVGLLGLACVSALDDRGTLPIGFRLIAQIAAVGWTMAWMLTPLAWGTIVLCGLVWIWSINLYNFMDGADGMAGAMTFVGFGCYAIAAAATDPAITMASVTAAGAALGFLRFNRSPAKLFLGDVGSIPLGFLAAAVGILGWHQRDWPLWFPVVVFSPFVADATVTLLRRLFRGEAVWCAHREHYYQRLIQSGISHGRTTLLWFAGMLLAAGLALLLRMGAPPTQWIGIALWFIALAVAGAIIDRRWSKAITGNASAHETP